MSRPKKKSETLNIYMTPVQRSIIESKATAMNTTMSEFILCAALDQPLNQGTSRLNDTVLHIMNEQQKMLHIIARLILYVGAAHSSDEEVMDFFNDCRIDAEKLYGNGSEQQ